MPHTASAAAIKIAIARFFYANSIPYHVASSTFFTDMLDNVAKGGSFFLKSNRSWPDRNAVGGDMLLAEYERQKCFIDGRLDNIGSYGFTIVGDGATNQGAPLQNYYVQSCDSGPLYIMTEDATDHLAEGGSKDAGFIADGFISVLKDLGGKEGRAEMKHVKQCVQIVCDGANVNRAAFKIITDRFPWIFCSWCIPHIVNLFLKDVYKEVDVVKEVVDRASKLNTFFRGHASAAALMKKPCVDRFKQELGLIQPCDTRFGLYFVMLHRQLRLYEVFLDVVTSALWKNLKGVASEDEKDAIAATVLDKDHWDMVRGILKSLWPAILILRSGDSDQAGTSKVYHHLTQARKVLEYQDDLPLDILPSTGKMLRLWDKRLKDAIGDIHYAAAALDPRLHGQKYWEDVEVARGLDSAIMTAFCVIEDEEERNEKYLKVATELEFYKKKQGVFAYEFTWIAARSISAQEWWDKYKPEVPTLSWFAQRVLAQVISSSASERGHKAAKKVRQKKRNRMGAIKLDKELFVSEALKTKDKLVDTDSAASQFSKWTELDEHLGAMAQDAMAAKEAAQRSDAPPPPTLRQFNAFLEPWEEALISQKSQHYPRRLYDKYIDMFFYDDDEDVDHATWKIINLQKFKKSWCVTSMKVQVNAETGELEDQQEEEAGLETYFINAELNRMILGCKLNKGVVFVEAVDEAAP